MNTYTDIYRKYDGEYEEISSVGMDGYKLQIMKGTKGTSNGEIGLVPKPLKGNKKYLCGNGEWESVYGKEDIELLKLIYPVNKIYISVSDTNPSELFGFGTWTLIACGETLIGVDENDTEFQYPKKSKGKEYETVSLVADNLPSHTHTINNHTHTINNHFHPVNRPGAMANPSGTHMHGIRYEATVKPGSDGRNPNSDFDNHTSNHATSEDGLHEHTFSSPYHTTNSSGACTTSSNGASNTGSTGNGEAHPNLQPYITCYIWLRVS